MKSEHRAKADFLRELAKYAKELYELGDFTCEDEKRVILSSKVEGFAAAGSIIELVSTAAENKKGPPRGDPFLFLVEAAGV